MHDFSPNLQDVFSISCMPFGKPGKCHPLLLGGFQCHLGCFVFGLGKGLCMGLWRMDASAEQRRDLLFLKMTQTNITLNHKKIKQGSMFLSVSFMASCRFQTSPFAPNSLALLYTARAKGIPWSSIALASNKLLAWLKQTKSTKDRPWLAMIFTHPRLARRNASLWCCPGLCCGTSLPPSFDVGILHLWEAYLET